MDYQNRPAFQKMMQRIMSLRPDQAAVPRSFLARAEAGAAEQEMLRHLDSMQEAQRQTRMERRGDLAEERLGLRERGLDIAEDLANQRYDLASRGLGLRESGADFQANSDDAANAIAWAGVPISAGLGWADLKAKQDLAAKRDALNALVTTSVLQDPANRDALDALRIKNPDAYKLLYGEGI